jgi:hypothetical protein
MRASAVQFRGIDQVIDAYEQNDMPSWSIWPSKEDMTFAYVTDDTGDGANMLRACLEKLRNGQTEGIYKLKVYDDLDPDAKLNSKTPASRSFNFSLWGSDEENPTGKRNTGIMGRMEARLVQMQDEMVGAILDKIDREEEEERQPEKVGGVMGFLNGVFEMPGVKEWIGAAAVSLASKIVPMNNRQPAPAQVAGVGGATSGSQVDRAKAAVEVLASVDPMVGDHMEKLARMAVEEPGKYKMALSFL